MSAATTPKTYKNIKVTDPSEAIWVSTMKSYETFLEDVKERRSYGDFIILIGPTGSGKSSSIEAIASKSKCEPLGIAKDQLESVTQQACFYEVKNLTDTYNGKIYIIDTPGFADPRISELEVLDKMAFWRDKSQVDDGYVRLLYFHPITDIRMPASRKRCVDMIQRFWGLRLSRRVMLVTSMWDRVPARCRAATETRFTQLSTGHWGDWIEGGASAFKFENTFDSAMEVLDNMCAGKNSRGIYPQVLGLGMEGTTGNPVYEALSSRLSSLELKRATLLEDLALPGTQSQTELLNILTADLNQTDLLLQKFNAEMADFLKRYGSPQDSPQTAQTLVDAEVIDAAPTTTDPLDSTPEPIPANVADPAVTETVGVDSAAPEPDIANTISTASGSADPATTRVAEVIRPQKVSRFNQLSQWAHKKIDKIHFGRRNGA